MLKIKGEKLKIGIVCYPSIGGSGIVATNLGLELAKHGHEIHFMSYEEPFRLQENQKNIFFHKVKINEYALFKYPDYTLPLAVVIEEVQRRYVLDVVHVHYAVPHATAALLARRIMRQNGTPLPKIITTLHGTDITLLARDPSPYAIIKYSIERSHGVTTVSQSLKQDTEKILRCQHPIEVIYNFFDPPKPSKTRAQMRKELKIGADDFLAIHSSNLRSIKRIPDLLKIASKFKKDPKFKLLVLSGGDFNQHEPLVKKYGVAEKIIVKDGVKDIENYMSAADLGIYTSETESFGMGMLETMSYGKPVLSTNTGGVPEVLRDGQDGFLFKVGDTDAFAGKIKNLMDDEKLLHQLGENARVRALNTFSSQKIVREYLNYYHRILTNF